MKPRFFLSLILLMAGSAASAQLQDPWLKVTGKPGTEKAPRFHSSIKDYYLEGALVDSNRLGKIYQMPVDKMHCLVPDPSKTISMPVQQLKMPEPMPNAMVRRRNNPGNDK